MRSRIALRRDLGFQEISIDLELQDDIVFWRHARLPGAQYDLHVRVVQLIADVAHERETRVLRFHHHVSKSRFFVAM